MTYTLPLESSQDATSVPDGIVYRSEMPWPVASIPAVYGLPWDGNGWAIAAQLDAYGKPWELFDDDDGAYIAVPAGDGLAMAVLQDAGDMQADSVFSAFDSGLAGVDGATLQAHDNLALGLWRVLWKFAVVAGLATVAIAGLLGLVQ